MQKVEEGADQIRVNLVGWWQGRQSDKLVEALRRIQG